MSRVRTRVDVVFVPCHQDRQSSLFRCGDAAVESHIMARKVDRKVEYLEAELLRLGLHDRAALAKSLLDSLENLSEEEYEQRWAEEAESRYADFKAARTSAVSGDEGFARARARSRGRLIDSSKKPTSNFRNTSATTISRRRASATASSRTSNVSSRASGNFPRAVSAFRRM